MLTTRKQGGLYDKQTQDQAMRTGLRGLLSQVGNPGLPLPQQQSMPPAQPDFSNSIEEANNQFYTGVAATPGASEALGVNPAAGVPMPEGAPLLLPPINWQTASPSASAANYTPDQLARITAAIQDNPNPADLMEAKARAEFLAGNVSEPRSRELYGAQGKMPTINTAVTPTWQADVLNNRAANARAINDADNAALMERTQMQQQGALARAMMTAQAGGKGGNVSFSEGQKMQEVADKMSDQFFGIQRDDAGNVTNQVMNPAVLEQAQALSRRTRLYIQNQNMDPIGARTQAAKDLFGSANRTDPAGYNQASSGLFGFGSQPFSAKNINQDALGEVTRAGAPELNGPSSARDAMNMERLGTATGGTPSVFGPFANGLVGSTTPVAQPTAQPAAPNLFALRPTNAEVKQREANQKRIIELEGQVAQIEKELTAGQTTISPLVASMNMGGMSATMPQSSRTINLNTDNDAANARITRRNLLLKEINDLKVKSGNAPSMNDIERQYAP
jgi:hypothetical protein